VTRVTVRRKSLVGNDRVEALHNGAIAIAPGGT